MELSKAGAKSAIVGGKKREKSVSTKGLDFIITGSIVLVFFLCPIFFTGLAAQGMGFEKMILFYFLVLLGIVAWVTKGVIAGELNLKRTPLDLPIIIGLVIFLTSTFFSISSKDSLIGAYGGSAKSLVALIILSLFYYLVVNNINAKKIKLIFMALLASGSLLIIYSFLQLRGIYLLPEGFTKSVSFNPIGSLSGLTQFIIIMLPMFIIGVAQIHEIFPNLKRFFALIIKAILGLVALAGLIILAFLNGFTFWPIAIVGIVIILMFFLAKIIKISNNNLLIPLFTFLALIILLVLGNFQIMDKNLPAEVSLSRGASWNIAKSSLKENPILGSGPGTFYYSFSKYKSAEFNSSPLWNVRFDSGSGALFELLATVGVLGAVAAGILGLIALSLTFLTLIKTEAKSEHSILLAAFASFITAGLFAVLFALNNSMILIVGLISIFAVSAALIMYPEKFKLLKLSFRSSAKYALALSAIFLTVSAGVVVLFTMGLKMYLADVHASQAMSAGDVNGKIKELDRAIELAPYRDIYYINAANNYMALANQEALGSKDQTKIQQNLALAIERGKKAVEIAGNKASNNESLGLIYENASFYTRGALEWAEDLYNKVTKLEPANPTPYLRIALVNMARANAESDTQEKEFYINEAIKSYDKAIAKKGDLAAAYYGKSIAYEKLNNIDGAIEQLKKANLVSRDNLDYRFELGRLYFNRGVTQPDLAQTASKEIAVEDITPPSEENGTSTPPQEELSVKPSQPTGAAIGRNNDLNAAEQIFLSVLLANQKHANARYSLAVLYQKIGELDKAKIMANSLLDLLSDGSTKDAVMKQFEDIL